MEPNTFKPKLEKQKNQETETPKNSLYFKKQKT